MGEVSGKTIGIFRKISEHTGSSIEQMFAGTSCPSHGDGDPEFIPWSEFCVLCRRAREACGGNERFADMGAKVLELPELGRIASIIQLFASAKTLYWANKRWTGPSLFTHLGNDFEEIDNGLFRFTITIPEEHEDCPEFFHLNGGVMRSLPKLIGLPEAFVELDLSPRRCVYTIDPPPSITLWARLRRAFAFIFRARSAIEALGEQQTLLARRYKELLATREDLERARDEAVQARLEAEQALAIKSQFLATMSHELRTPLNGVIGMSELLTHTELDDEQSEYASTIHGCGQTLLHLINDVLDYSKLEAHKLSITPSVFDVREVVENVLDMLGGQARAQGLELGADFGDIPRFIETDPHRLQQVLLNLVGNAVKFTSHGEVFVSVEEIDHSKDSTTLRFSVRDTGAGIPESFLPQLFTPFTQADGSSTRTHGGTGLGLAISKELVACLGGTIEVESTVDQGSVFHFTIRASLAQAPPDEQPLPPLGSFSILVVDDNPTNRVILTRTLQRWHLDVQTVGSGPAALRACATQSFDAIVLDLRMPTMDGLDLVRQLQADSSTPTPRLLMVTASGDRHDAQAARDLGIEAYLTKPFRQAQLHAALTKLLRNAVPTSHSPPTRAPSPPARGHVLVVDDNAINLRFALHAIKRLGYTCTGASSGHEAIDLVERQRFDFIFMDCEMPEQNGFDTTAVLRATDNGATLPIVALTAHATEEIRARCREVGMNDFITKPPGLERLQEILTQWIPKESTNPASSGARERAPMQVETGTG